MIVKEEFLSRLRRYFSLNLYEVKIWTALLSQGVSTAGELSDIANVPRSRSYDVLESLEKKGFVILKLGKPIKYLAVNPNEVIERVKKNFQALAKDRISNLENLKGTDLLSELTLLHKQGIELVEPMELSGSIRGRHNVYNHLDFMLRGASKSISLITTSEGLIRKIDALRPTLEKMKKKGVKIRIAAPLTKETKRLAKELAPIAEVKPTTSNARFCVIDGKEALLMVMDDKQVHPSYDVGIWIKSPYFASALENLYDLHWKKGV